jgi:hypothetical protein
VVARHMTVPPRTPSWPTTPSGHHLKAAVGAPVGLEHTVAAPQVAHQYGEPPPGSQSVGGVLRLIPGHVPGHEIAVADRRGWCGLKPSPSPARCSERWPPSGSRALIVLDGDDESRAAQGGQYFLPVCRTPGLDGKHHLNFVQCQLGAVRECTTSSTLAALSLTTPSSLLSPPGRSGMVTFTAR